MTTPPDAEDRDGASPAGPRPYPTRLLVTTIVLGAVAVLAWVVVTAFLRQPEVGPLTLPTIALTVEPSQR